MCRQKLASRLLRLARRKLGGALEKVYRAVEILRVVFRVVCVREDACIFPAVPAVVFVLRFLPDIEVFENVPVSVAVILPEKMLEGEIEFLARHVGIQIHNLGDMPPYGLHSEPVCLKL